jgi:guanylate cyclase soluble subunit beta
MYGVIHRAVRQMVLDRLGKHAWSEIESAAGIGYSQLISAELYDDEVTLALLDGAARRTGIDMDEFLFEFGRYWIRYAQSGSFGAILNFTGHDFPTFIRNLNRLHDSVREVMPKARMPRFALVSERQGEMLVEYRSTRQGLGPFVRGLLHGLLDHFGLMGEVTMALGESGEIRFLISHQLGSGA